MGEIESRLCMCFACVDYHLCPQGSFRIANKCYRELPGELSSRFDAQQACSGSGGSLIMIDTEGKQNITVQFLQEKGISGLFWIGEHHCQKTFLCHIPRAWNFLYYNPILQH